MQYQTMARINRRRRNRLEIEVKSLERELAGLAVGRFFCCLFDTAIKQFIIVFID